MAGETMIYLQLNGGNVACAHGTGSLPKGGLTMTLVSTLQLKKDDKVSLVITGGSVTAFYSSTHFTSWLLEEE